METAIIWCEMLEQHWLHQQVDPSIDLNAGKGLLKKTLFTNLCGNQ